MLGLRRRPDLRGRRLRRSTRSSTIMAGGFQRARRQVARASLSSRPRTRLRHLLDTRVSDRGGSRHQRAVIRLLDRFSDPMTWSGRRDADGRVAGGAGTEGPGHQRQPAQELGMGDRHTFHEDERGGLPRVLSAAVMKPSNPRCPTRWSAKAQRARSKRFRPRSLPPKHPRRTQGDSDGHQGGCLRPESRPVVLREVRG